MEADAVKPYSQWRFSEKYPWWSFIPENPLLMMQECAADLVSLHKTAAAARNVDPQSPYMPVVEKYACQVAAAEAHYASEGNQG